jgi:transposase
MAKAYSNDLRRKFIEAHRQGEGSLAELAGRFHVSVGWAKKVSATFSRSGSWERPPQSRYGRRSKFTPQVRLRLGEWIDEQPDLTLHELQSRLHAELGLKASIGRLWGLLREMGLRLKKSHSTPPSRTARRTASGAPYGASK